MSIKEAAEALGVSVPFIYTLEKRGQLTVKRNPLYRHGPVQIPREQVEALKAQIKKAAD